VPTLQAAALAGALALGAALPAACLAQAAPIGERQIVELAGQGRYDELAQRLAARDRLDAGEQHALCYAWSRLKRYRPLFACLDRLETALRGRDRASLLFGLDDATPTVHVMRAEAMLDLGQVAASAEQAQRALAWFDREGTAGERDIQIDALAAAAIAAARGRETARAQQHLQKIESIKAGFTAGPNVANTRTFALARGYLALGQYDRACAALEADKHFDFRRTVEELLHGNPPNWVWQQLPRNYMLAKCRFGMGRIAEAKARYDELLRLPAVKQNSGLYWMILYDRGQIAEGEGDRDGAIRLFREAIDVIELLRASVDTEAAKIGFVADKQAVYGALLAQLVAGNRAAEALEVAERAKARALVDLLADRYSIASILRLDHGDARVATLLDQHRQAEETLLAQAPGRDEVTYTQQRASVATATANVRKAAPELASLISVAPASAAELARLLDRDEVGVQYFLHGEQLFAVVFGAQGSRGFTLAGADLVRDIRDFRSAILRRSPQATELARKLYARLIEPLAPALGNRALLIVPHSALHYLPFAALFDGKQYLLEKHALRVTTSASALQFLRKATPGTRGAALILGNPTLDLPSAEQEARSLARLLPGASVLLGKAATKQALVAGGPRYRTVHIAGHGVFDANEPLDSRLLLAPAAADSGELRVGELYGLTLVADLVTLSACETGLGRITNGGDVIGMTRGFLYAGASTVVASLWQVADEATLELMERFYTNLGRMNKRDAMRAAQLEIARRIPQPYFWAAFYLTGSSG
jgi:CHAT domain-containing protein